MTNLNWVDLSVLAIFLLSMLAGLMRGFVKEIIGLIAWVAAFIIACLFASRLASAFTSSNTVQSAMTNSSMNLAEPVSLVSLGISFVCIFVVVLIIGKVISFIISGAVEGTGVSFINRFLGAVFGLARGFLLVIVTMFLVGLSPMAGEYWWTESQFVNYFQPIVKMVGEKVQPGLEDLKSKVGQTISKVNEKVSQVYP